MKNPSEEILDGIRDASPSQQAAACIRQLAPILDCLLDLGVKPAALVAALAHLSMMAVADRPGRQ